MREEVGLCGLAYIPEMGDFGGCELFEKKSRRPQSDGTFGWTPPYDAASRRMVEHTEIEKDVQRKLDKEEVTSFASAKVHGARG